MMRKTGQLVIRISIISTREHNAQNLGRFDRIFPERLIKVPDPKEQNGSRVFGFDLIKLSG